MFWLRALIFAAPLTVTFCAVMLFRQVSRLELPEEGQEMNCVIREPVGLLNPLLPLSGTTREVTDLVFEPLCAPGRALDNVIYHLDIFP